MIKENIKENVIENKSMSEIIKEKRDNFMKVVFSKYSFEQMRDFAFFHKLVDKSSIQGTFIGSNIVFQLMAVILLAASLNEPGIGILLASGMGLTIPISIFFTESKYFKNKVFKMWKRKNENLLKDKMFENSIVDDEVLKCFVKQYSEEKLVKMLLEKDSLTYNDISQYSIKKDEERELKDKEIRLTKAVKCLS